MDVRFSRNGEDDGWVLEIVDGKNYYLLEICDDNDVCVLKCIDGNTTVKDISIEELFNFDKVKNLIEDNTDLSDAVKELTEFKKGLMKSYKKHIAQYKILQESRDEVLVFLNQSKEIIGKHLIKKQWFDNIWWDEFNEVIQKAEDVKKKDI